VNFDRRLLLAFIQITLDRICLIVSILPTRLPTRNFQHTLARINGISLDLLFNEYAELSSRSASQILINSLLVGLILSLSNRLPKASCII
jgi:hypothetical protein